MQVLFFVAIWERRGYNEKNTFEAVTDKVG